MRDYRKLDTFQRAHELVLCVYKLTRGFPGEERFGLTQQLRRAAVSITSNIVEGSARTSETEYRRFLEIAHSSSWEVEYQLQLAIDLEYLSVDDPPVMSSVELCRRVSRMLSALLQAFAKEGRQ